MSPILARLASDYGIRADQAGFAVTAYSLAAAAAALTLGPTSDRRGHRGMLLIGLAVFVAGSFCSSLAPSFATVLGSRFVCGAGAGLVSLAITAYVSVAVPYERRGRAMGIVQSGYLVALLVGVPAGAVLAERLGVRGLFAAFGALGTVLLLCLARLEPHVAGEQAASHRDFLTFFAGSGPRLGLAVAFFTALGINAAITFLGAWLARQFGLKTGEIGVLFPIAGVAALLAGPLSGRLSDRIGKTRVAAASGLGLAACLAAFPLLEGALPLVIAAFIGAIFFESARRGPLQAYYTGLVPVDRVGAFTALKNSAAQMGLAAGSAMGALLFDRPHGFAWICVFSALATVLSTLLLRGAREPVR